MYIYFALFIIWLVLAYFNGTKDAILFYYRSCCDSSDRLNTEHRLFTIQRIVVGALIELAYFISMPSDSLQKLTKLIVFGIMLILSYSYIHNGRYFQKRNNLNNEVYPLRWRTWKSESSTSKIEICYGDRIAMFIISVLLFGFIYYLDYLFNM